MSTRTIVGVVSGASLFALAVLPHTMHADECSPYAAQLGLNPGPQTPENPYGLTCCLDVSVTAVGDSPLALIMLVLCMIGAAVLVRIARLRTVLAVVGVGVAGVSLGGFVGFVYSGLGIVELVLDPGFHFSLLVAAVVAGIMASLELRRMPNTSVERTRER